MKHTKPVWQIDADLILYNTQPIYCKIYLVQCIEAKDVTKFIEKLNNIEITEFEKAEYGEHPKEVSDDDITFRINDISNYFSDDEHKIRIGYLSFEIMTSDIPPETVHQIDVNQSNIFGNGLVPEQNLPF